MPVPTRVPPPPSPNVPEKYGGCAGCLSPALPSCRRVRGLSAWPPALRREGSSSLKPLPHLRLPHAAPPRLPGSAVPHPLCPARVALLTSLKHALADVRAVVAAEEGGAAGRRDARVTSQATSSSSAVVVGDDDARKLVRCIEDCLFFGLKVS